MQTLDKSPQEARLSPRTGVVVRHPVIVIGIPCHNEERYLQRAIDSLLAQTWTDFAVLISDNGSTDRTAEIGREAAAGDTRFHYHRHPRNIGGADNFNFIRVASDSPFIMWFGAHDHIAPSFLERHLEVMQANPAVSVCYCHAAWIDDSGEPYHLTTSRGMDTLPDNPLARFLLTPRYVDFCTEINNVIRRDFLTEPFGHVFGCDMITLAELAYRGPYRCIHEPLYMMYRVPESRRPEDYMKRLTGNDGVPEDYELFFEQFDARLRKLAPRHPLRPLASLVLRAQLEKRYAPEKAGKLAVTMMLLGKLKQLWRGVSRAQRRRG
jgi:glycosyltransferase involved in cell wall biosynthesis